MEELDNLSKISFLLLIIKKLFAKLNGQTQESNETPDADKDRICFCYKNMYTTKEQKKE